LPPQLGQLPPGGLPLWDLRGFLPREPRRKGWANRGDGNILPPGGPPGSPFPPGPFPKPSEALHLGGARADLPFGKCLRQANGPGSGKWAFFIGPYLRVFILEGNRKPMGPDGQLFPSPGGPRFGPPAPMNLPPCWPTGVLRGARPWPLLDHGFPPVRPPCPSRPRGWIMGPGPGGQRSCPVGFPPRGPGLVFPVGPSPARCSSSPAHCKACPFPLLFFPSRPGGPLPCLLYFPFPRKLAILRPPPSPSGPHGPPATGLPSPCGISAPLSAFPFPPGSPRRSSLPSKFRGPAFHPVPSRARGCGCGQPRPHGPRPPRVEGEVSKSMFQKIFQYIKERNMLVPINFLTTNLIAGLGAKGPARQGKQAWGPGKPKGRKRRRGWGKARPCGPGPAGGGPGDRVGCGEWASVGMKPARPKKGA